MTVNRTDSRVQYSCDGIITTYAYAFKIYEDDDLIVTKTGTDLTETTLVLNTDYTVTGAGGTGGTVELTDGPTCADDFEITITRAIELLQEEDFVDGEAFSAEDIENALDKAMLVAQDQGEDIGRAPLLKKSSDLSDLELPDPTANYLIGWDSSATGFKNFSTDTVSVPTIDYIGNYADLATAVSTIGSTPTMLMINAVAPIADGVTVTTPSTLTLWIPQGGSISGTGTLSVNGSIDAGRYQIFDDATTVVFGESSNVSVANSWFDSIENAIDAVSASGKTLTIDAVIDETATVPVNVPLDWKSGVVTSGAITLTINGPLTAGNYQIFGDNLTVNYSSDSAYKLSWRAGDLETAIVDCSTDTVHLIIDTKPDDLTGALTTLSTTTLDWRQGKTIGGAFKLTVGKLQAGLYQLWETDIDVEYASESVDYIYPQWRNILGDSSTDNTAAIDLMISDLENNPVPVKLVGVYKTQGEHIINFDNFSMFADSWDSGFIFDAQASTNILFSIRKDLYATSGAANWVRGTNLHDFKITATGGSNLYGYSFHMIRGAQNNVFDRIEIAGGKIGVKLEGSLETSVFRCYLHEQNTNGIYLTQLVTPAVTGTTNTISDSIISGTVSGIGILSEYQKTLTIKNNVLEAIYQSAIWIDGGSGVVIFDNHLEDNNTSDGATLGAIQIDDAITAETPENISVIYNRFTSVPVAATRAVHVVDGNRVRITGNTIISPGVIYLGGSPAAENIWISMNTADTYSGTGKSVRQNGMGTNAGPPTATNWYPGDSIHDTTNSRLYIVDDAGTAVHYTGLTP